MNKVKASQVPPFKTCRLSELRPGQLYVSDWQPELVNRDDALLFLVVTTPDAPVQRRGMVEVVPLTAAGGHNPGVVRWTAGDQMVTPVDTTIILHLLPPSA